MLEIEWPKYPHGESKQSIGVKNEITHNALNNYGIIYENFMLRIH